MSEYLSTPKEVWEVLPVNDLKEHVNESRCWCKPRIETAEGGNRVVIHNSADGREFFEQDTKGH